MGGGLNREEGVIERVAWYSQVKGLWYIKMFHGLTRCHKQHPQCYWLLPGVQDCQWMTAIIFSSYFQICPILTVSSVWGIWILHSCNCLFFEIVQKFKIVINHLLKLLTKEQEHDVTMQSYSTYMSKISSLFRNKRCFFLANFIICEKEGEPLVF